MNNTKVFVYISLNKTNHLVGTLWSNIRKGQESAAFEYDETWLRHPERFALEPALRLTAAPFYTQHNQRLFGAIGDSAPDRWGRILMRRAETARARTLGETPQTLHEIDFLLGVDDQTRQGALRFSKTLNGPFLNNQHKRKVLPLVDLPKLLSVTERFLDDEENAEDLKLLLAPGSSLGGARPKASVRSANDSLAIAKFPHKEDEFNVVSWEAVALDLAEKAGIRVPSRQLKIISEKPVLILNRFDRIHQERVPFLSAMSMLGAKDNEEHSYLEIADALRQYGAMPEADMAELWRRIVFNILISNTDDHLRNHAFLYDHDKKGWRLSPAYDINPTPVEIKPRILTTAIDLFDRTASLDLALSIADHFRLSQSTTKSIIRDVHKSVEQWRKIAQSFGLQKKEIERMASAFEHEDAKKAAFL